MGHMCPQNSRSTDGPLGLLHMERKMQGTSKLELFLVMSGNPGKQAFSQKSDGSRKSF